MTTATIQNYEARLSSMIGKTYMVNANNYKVMSYHFEGDKLMIGTDKKIFPIELANVNKILDMFLETDPEETPNAQLVQFEMKSLSGAGEIKDILMDNIRKVQANKEYIPQAAAVNEGVKALLDFAKTEIQMYELMYKMNYTKKP